MKIVFIEPNLKDNFGHVYTVMRAIDDYAKSYRDNKYEFFLVSNENIKNKALNSFNKIYPEATAGCFETKNPTIVKNYITDIIKKFNLKESDGIVFPTAHFNEIIAAEKLSKKTSSPNFLLHIHQFYPPMQDSDSIKNKNVYNSNKIRFQKILRQNSREKVTIVTTRSEKLNKILSRIARYKLPTIDVPMYLKNNKKSDAEFSFSFLGDGRREKGLHLFVESAISLLMKSDEYNFLFHIPNLRYFSEEKLNNIKLRIDYLKKNYAKNIVLIEKKLTSDEYEEVLQKTKCVILPYNPLHYDKRISGIAEECGCLGIPVITSKGTVVGENIDNREQSGIVFKYYKENDTLTTKSLLNAITTFNKNPDHYENLATKLKLKFLKKTNINRYIDSCVKLLTKT